MTTPQPSVQAASPKDAGAHVSLVIAGLDEAAIVEKNLRTLCEYMRALEQRYAWEIVFVNDGSSDDTGVLAERVAADYPQVRVLHHPSNFGLGQALRFAFANCRGDYVVVLDVDLSYGPAHIPLLVSKMVDSGAKVVASSPYMAGGKISNVPWFRKALTIVSNRFLSFVAKGNLSSLTPMVRAYDRDFLNRLDLRAMGMDINLEIIYKAMLLNARIEEVPSHLDWSLQRAEGSARQSKMKIMRQSVAVLVSGFLFRPVLFFVIPGLVFLVLSAYANVWLCVHIIEEYARVGGEVFTLERFDSAVAAAFQVAPHTFVVGGLTLVIGLQLVGLGVLALQNLSYFEQLFHLGSSILRGQRGS